MTIDTTAARRLADALHQIAIGDEEGVSAEAAALVSAGINSLAGLRVTNLAGLRRWGDARGAALVRPVSISTLGDSVSWGVGSDDTANTTNEDVMRERAWCVQLRKRLNRAWGTPDAHGWMGLRPAFASGEVTSGATASSSIGPYGSFSGGGVSITSGGTVTWPAATSKLGAFTEIDVWYWGSEAGVTGPREPLVTVDGTAKNAPAASSVAGNLNKVTVTGLTDATHEVVLSTAGGTCYLFGVTVRRGSTGFTMNRVAKSGAKTTDIFGSQTGAAKARNIDAALLDSSLLIVALGANDQSGQVPLETYKSTIQDVIDRQVARGGCVLLAGEPPRAVTTGEIGEPEYRTAMRSLAGGANKHVAYVDWADFMGTGVEAYQRGLFPDYNTVHPSAKGHGVIADAMFELLSRTTY